MVQVQKYAEGKVVDMTFFTWKNMYFVPFHSLILE